jgi:hypothetical protein
MLWYSPDRDERGVHAVPSGTLNILAPILPGADATRLFPFVLSGLTWNISGNSGTQHRHHFPEIGAFMNYKRAHTK